MNELLVRMKEILPQFSSISQHYLLCKARYLNLNFFTRNNAVVFRYVKYVFTDTHRDNDPLIRV
jgi:hypothetical protein